MKDEGAVQDGARGLQQAVAYVTNIGARIAARRGAAAGAGDGGGNGSISEDGPLAGRSSAHERAELAGEFEGSMEDMDSFQVTEVRRDERVSKRGERGAFSMACTLWAACKARPSMDRHTR